VPYPGNSPGFLFSLEKREEEEIPCISFVIWIFAVDYIDTGVHYIFVKLARDRRRSSYRQMGLQGRERSALGGGPPGPISKLNVFLTTGDFFLTL
jgi:hypothetical protein